MDSPTFRGMQIIAGVYSSNNSTAVEREREREEGVKVIGPRSVRKSDIAARRVSLVGGSGPAGCLLETPTASTAGLSEVKVCPLPRKLLK